MVLIMLANPELTVPSKYWGTLVYATPGSGKTWMARRYHNVVDGDELIVEAICELHPTLERSPGDPRKTIFRYFRYIHFNAKCKAKVYQCALQKMKHAAYKGGKLVLFGTMDWMKHADYIFLQTDKDFVRSGFTMEKMGREQVMAAKQINGKVRYVQGYLKGNLVEERGLGFV